MTSQPFFLKYLNRLLPLKSLILRLHSSNCFVVLFCASLSFATFFLKWDNVAFQCWLNQCCMERWKLSSFCFYLLLLNGAWSHLPFLLICPLHWKSVLIFFHLWHLNFSQSIFFTDNLCRGSSLHSLYLYNFSGIKRCPMTPTVPVM